MTTDPREPPQGSPPEGHAGLSRAPSEEETVARSTPRKDLISAIAIAALSLFVMALSLRMPNPGSLHSAPGLLPFLTGLSLLAMAFGLGLPAVRNRGARGLVGDFGSGFRAFFTNEENLRLFLLLGVIFAYVLLVDIVTFDLRIPLTLGGLEYRFSSFEFITILVLTLILRVFWRAPVLRCLLVSLPTTIFLAAIFRYGFKVLLPGSG